LQGKTRDLIAKDNSIGTGTVSEIINQYRQRGSDFDLMRQVALTLKDHQTDMGSFAAAIRLRRILEEAGLSEDDMESLIVNAEVHYFKHGMKLQEFFNTVDEVSDYSNMIGISLKELPDHITQQQNVLEQLKVEIKQLNEKIKEIKTKKENELRDYDKIRRELEDLVENKHLIDKLGKVQEELNSVTKQKDSCYKELETVKTVLAFNKDKWMAIVPDLDKANEQLRNYSPFIPLGSHQLFLLAKELYYFPSHYVDVIFTMQKRLLDYHNTRNKSKPNEILY
jgi:chromosome segregation ATPase